MANMGVGNKPLMDIGGSNTITDRSVPIQTGKLNFTLFRNRQNTHPNQIPNIADYRRKTEGVLKIGFALYPLLSLLA